LAGKTSSGLGLRVTLIMSLSLLVLLVALAVFAWAQNRGERAGFRLPLPDQVAAIADLVEATPPERLGALLRAVNSETLRVTVAASPPSSAGTISAPALGWILRGYVAAGGGRKVEAMFQSARGEPPTALPTEAAPGETTSAAATTLPIRFVVTLRDGRALVLETRRPGLTRFTGFRLVLVLLLAAIVISSATLLYLRRQVGPIERLAALVERVGSAAEGGVTEGRNAIAALGKTGGPETRQLAAAITGMQQRIHDLVAGRSRMLAAIGHDFGTYLTRLRLRSEFIADSAQRAAAIRDIEAMDALISDSVTLARGDHNPEPRMRMDLVALLRRHAEGFASVGELVQIETEDTPPIEIEGQPVALGRALANLIGNALRYGGRADASILRDGSDAVIRVQDRGPGIPPEERERVLEPFHRGDAARNLDRDGFGLGLAIVADTVRRNRGTLAFSDREGGGLCVTLRFPLFVRE
jgi:signal transduction histidine kinase